MSGETDKQIVFACQCGTTYRTRAALAGRKARCRKCGEPLTIPTGVQNTDDDVPSTVFVNTVAGGTTPESTPIKATCSICQCAIEPDEPLVLCDQCGLPFHDECWRDNMGCSAYGCPNVNGLKAGPDICIPIPPPLPKGVAPVASPPDDDRIPWEYVFLATSVLASLLGLVMCGVPTLFVASGIGVYWAMTPRRVSLPIAVSTLVICGLGFFAGAFVTLAVFGSFSE